VQQVGVKFYAYLVFTN